MRNVYSLAAGLVLALSLLTACRSDYEKMVDRELARGIRNDSIFLGFYFGMPQDSFLKYCWHKNQEGRFFHGAQTSEISVLYHLQEFANPINMNFYPLFSDRKIYRMWTVFSYEDWAPWKTDLSSKNLFGDVRALIEKWYGGGLLEMKTPKGTPFWVKIDGNRQILLTVPTDQTVRMEITDLTSPEAFKPTNPVK